MSAASGLPPVVLSGAMGTGKTTIGRAVASQLGRSFIDIDAELEAEHQSSCADLIREKGTAFFRQQERALVERVVFDQKGADCVIALGGGALCDHGRDTAPGPLLEFVRRIHEQCTSVLLDVDSQDDDAWAQLDVRTGALAAQTRPLLALDGRALLRSRLAMYRRAFLRVDAMAPEAAVVDSVIARVIASENLAKDEKPLAVQAPTGAYPVWCATGGTSKVASALRAAGLAPKRVLVVSSPPIAVHAEKVAASLTADHIDVTTLMVPEGEAHKTAETLGTLWDAAATAKLGRDDVVVAVGGGVVGDMAGFCAATFMRGLPVVQVPTTLLAMVDASVGGKVAIDRPQGKNLVGHFWSPSAVVVDVETLKTLPAEEVRAGMSEALKHAYLANDHALREDLLALRTQDSTAALSLPRATTIRQAIAVKRDVVEVDPFERGVRATLNLGHTFAHALEKCRGFDYRHGDAVAVGLLAACHLGHAMGVTPSSVVDTVKSDLDHLRLDQRAEGVDADTLAQAMIGDKKQAKGRLQLVLLEAFGRAVTVTDPGHAQRVAAWRAVGAS